MDKLTHQQYTIHVEFIACSGVEEKAQEEIKNLLNHIKAKDTLSHVSNLKTWVTRKHVEDTTSAQEDPTTNG